MKIQYVVDKLSNFKLKLRPLKGIKIYYSEEEGFRLHSKKD